MRNRKFIWCGLRRDNKLYIIGVLQLKKTTIVLYFKELVIFGCM